MTEEVNCPLAIADLLQKDADSPIFVKLGLNYEQEFENKSLKS